MKILTSKKQTFVAKRLAAIYYMALHGYGKSKEQDIECMTKIVQHIADIADAVGGEEMMNIGIPALVYQIQEQAEHARRATI